MLTAGDFTRVIFSRKGLDSASGFGYSPFDPSTGRYIWIPIPASRDEEKIANTTRYEEIQIKPNHLPGIGAENLKELVFTKDLGYTPRTKDAISHRFAHVDPWLGNCPWLAEHVDHHIGALGQVKAAQGHLENQSVGVGSLFLFYSRFFPIGGRENRNEDCRKEAYYLYGWLKVGRVAKSMSAVLNEELTRRHPHATEKYFAKPQNKNTIYIADAFLSDKRTIQGCGYFPKLCKELLLTSNNSENPSEWQLPAFFQRPENRPTYLGKDWRWKPVNHKSWAIRIPGRGQEFVFKSSSDFAAWFSGIIEATGVNSPSPLH